MEPKVYFEHLGEPDRVEGIARLLLRRGRMHPHVLVLCPDHEFMSRLDSRLWTVHPESFLAHGIASGEEEDDAEHPILLALQVVHSNAPEVLINGGLEVPLKLSGFAHIVDFVDHWSEPLLAASRERFRTYRQLGLNPQYLGKGGEGAGA